VGDPGVRADLLGQRRKPLARDQQRGLGLPHAVRQLGVVHADVQRDDGEAEVRGGHIGLDELRPILGQHGDPVPAAQAQPEQGVGRAVGAHAEFRVGERRRGGDDRGPVRVDADGPTELVVQGDRGGVGNRRRQGHAAQSAADHTLGNRSHSSRSPGEKSGMG
jgi:hypothetical protein